MYYKCKIIEIAVNFVKPQPPRSLNEIGNLLLDNYSSGDISCFIMETTKLTKHPGVGLEGITHTAHVFPVNYYVLL